VFFINTDLPPAKKPIYGVAEFVFEIFRRLGKIVMVVQQNCDSDRRRSLGKEFHPQERIHILVLKVIGTRMTFTL